MNEKKWWNVLCAHLTSILRRYRHAWETFLSLYRTGVGEQMNPVEINWNQYSSVDTVDGMDLSEWVLQKHPWIIEARTNTQRKKLYIKVVEQGER